MDKWEGQVAVVTGASSGIGKAIAVSLAENGMKVAALARREELLQELSKNFKGKGEIRHYKCDVSNEEMTIEVFAMVEKDLGPVRVLVNNAGIATFTPFLDFDIAKWKKTFDVNFFGMFCCIKQVMDSAKKNNPGLIHIINVNSLAGHSVFDNKGTYAYTASKHTVTLMTKAFDRQIAIEKLNVKVTDLSPGLVATEIFETSGWHVDAELRGLASWPFLKPEDIANAALAVLQFPSEVLIQELIIKPQGQPF